jgi:hypothetical protein
LAIVIAGKTLATSMTVAESKEVKKGTASTGALSAKRVGMRSQITWDNGQVASVHHGDMREITRSATKTINVQPRP